MLKQLAVSERSRLWSLTLGYAITSNRIGSSELNENAFKGLTLAGSFIFAKDKVYIWGYYNSLHKPGRE